MLLMAVKAVRKRHFLCLSILSVHFLTLLNYNNHLLCRTIVKA